MSSLKFHFEKHAFLCILTYLTTAGLLRLLALLTPLGIPLFLSLLLPMICILIIRFLDCHREYIPVALITIGLLLLTLIYVYYKKGELPSLFSSFTALWTAPEQETEFPWLIFVQILILSVALSLPVYFLQQNILFRCITSAALFTVIVLLSVFEAEPEKIMILLFCGQILFVLFELMHRHTFPGPEDKQTVRTLYLYPAVLLLLAAIAFTPYNKDPIQWTLVKSVWANVVQTVSTLATNISLRFQGTSHVFEISFAGYSQDGDLGGNVKENNTNTLIISSSKLISQPVYLFGNQKNVYTGSDWSLSFSDSKATARYPEYILDTVEILYAVERCGFSESDHDVLYQNLFKTQEYNIAFHELRTRTIFYPAKTRHIFFTDTNTDDLLSSNLTFAQLQGPTTAYSLSFLEMNLGSPEFEALLKTSYSYDNSYSIDASSMTHLLRRNSITDFTGNHDELESILLQRSNEIRLDYLNLPASLPSRVKELAIELTKNASTDYEKLLAIEAYLRTYTYTLTPGSIPEDEDAVDYFLFTTKEGYCTYFATAMAVLSRCVGIPSRYVQGYCLRPQETDDFIYYVTNSDAHAWPECYLQGIGWIPFEPTPGFSAARYHPWHYETSNGTGYTENVYEPEISEIPEISMIPEVTSTSEAHSYKNTLLLSIIVPVMLFLLIAGYLLIKVKQAKNTYSHLSDNRKMAYNMAILYDLSKAMKIQTDESQTLQEHFKVLQNKYPELETVLFLLEEQYMCLRYGPAAMGDQAAAASLVFADQVRIFLLQQCRMNKSLLSYLALQVRLTLQYKVLP